MKTNRTTLLTWMTGMALFLSFTAASSKGQSAKDSIVMPTFMGGDVNTFSRWVSHRLKYPQTLIALNIDGRVITQFVIERDGTLSYQSTIQSVDTLFSNEVIRVAKSAPSWTPGLKNGEPVRVFIVIPVTFVLQNSRSGSRGAATRSSFPSRTPSGEQRYH